MDFVADIALAFIAFGVGKFFKKDALRTTGARVLVITIMEALLAGMLVAAQCFYFLILTGSLRSFLAPSQRQPPPASTVMTINQYHAHGEFVDTLLQIVALDDVVCLLVFSIAAAS